MCFWYYVVGIGFGLVFFVLFVFVGLDYVVECFLYFMWCLGVLDVYLGYGDIGFVGIQEVLQVFVYFGCYLFVVFGEDLVYGGGVGDMLQCVFGCLLQVDFGLVDVEYEVLQVVDFVLYGQWYFDDVFVFGEYLFLFVVCMFVGDVFLEVFVDWWEVEVQVGIDCFVIFVEVQDDCLFLFVYYIDGVVQLEYGEDCQVDVEQVQVIVFVVGIGVGIVVIVFFFIEQFVQVVLKFVESFIQVGWFFVVIIVVIIIVVVFLWVLIVVV